MRVALQHFRTVKLIGVKGTNRSPRRRPTPRYHRRSPAEWRMILRSGLRERTGMENELSRVVDVLPGLVWTALPDGRVDFINQYWCQLTGLSVDEGYGSGWQTAVHPQDLPQLLERWRSILASGKPDEMEARLRRSDGEYSSFVWRVSPLADASGVFVKWCGLGIDIDERMQAEE